MCVWIFLVKCLNSSSVLYKQPSHFNFFVYFKIAIWFWKKSTRRLGTSGLYASSSHSYMRIWTHAWFLISCEDLVFSRVMTENSIVPNWWRRSYHMNLLGLFCANINIDIATLVSLLMSLVLVMTTGCTAGCTYMASVSQLGQVYFYTVL